MLDLCDMPKIQIDISHSSDCLDHTRTSTKQQSCRIQPTQLNISPVRKALPYTHKPHRSANQTCCSTTQRYTVLFSSYASRKSQTMVLKRSYSLVAPGNNGRLQLADGVLSPGSSNRRGSVLGNIEPQVTLHATTHSIHIYIYVFIIIYTYIAYI